MVWDAQDAIKRGIETKLNEFEVEFAPAEKDALIMYLVNKGIVGIEKLKDLGNFIHYNTETLPKRSLLVNNFLVYVSETVEQVAVNKELYENYLDDNDLDEDDLSYETFLSDRGLEDITEEKVSYGFTSYKAPEILMDMAKRKVAAEKELALINDKLPILKEVTGITFLKTE